MPMIIEDSSTEVDTCTMHNLTFLLTSFVNVKSFECFIILVYSLLSLEQFCDV